MGELNPGIIICSRSDSTRIPNKPWTTIKGRYLIARLLDQLIKYPHPNNPLPKICLAVPEKDGQTYFHRLNGEFKNLEFYAGEERNPLKRMNSAADLLNFDPIIRITHDKIFIDTPLLREGLEIYAQRKLDYFYSSNIIDGSGFEIFSRSALNAAADLFSNQEIEHISYAIKCVAKNQFNYKPSTACYNQYSPDTRFLVDFEEDLDFIRAVFDFSRSETLTLQSALNTLEIYPFLKKINKLPEVTVYICAHNESEYILWAIESVMSQTIADKIEFIVIDDHSDDDTFKKVISSKHANRIKLKRNEQNIGLSSSSNVALNMARGKYIMRLDADDSLLFPFTLEKMLKKAKQEGFEALYPSYIDHKTKTCVDGSVTHHVGGCLFLTKAIRNIQFTEKLRGFEGLDLFQRAKDHIKIGYYDDFPAFFYRDRPNSMSKTNMDYRLKIKEGLDKGIYGHRLVASN